MGTPTPNNTGAFALALRNFRRRALLSYITAASPFLCMLLILSVAGQIIHLILLAQGLAGPYNPEESWAAMQWGARTGIILAFVLCAWAPPTIGAAGIALLTWEDSEGRTVTARGLLTALYSRLFTLITLGFIVGVGAILGSILFVLPGLIFLALAGFAIPAAIIEKLGPISALKRSFNLARGQIIRLAGIFLLITLVLVAIRAMLRFLMPMSLRLQIMGLLVFFAIAVTLIVFFSAVLTLLYRKARIERETAQARNS